MADMKNPHHELLCRKARQYHRNHQWRLSGGLFIPHAYPEPQTLSWWDDVGFILNGRRVIVWWQHPRWVYRCEIERRAMAEVPEPSAPDRRWSEPGIADYRKLGRSRKKVVSYSMPDISPEWVAYYEAVDQREAELMRSGIDYSVAPSVRIEQLAWATGVSLVAPIEVRNEAEVRALAALARRLLRREAALADIFPGYRYSTDDWVLEQGR